SLEAWRAYHQSEARLWERQALIKARPVAGDPALCRRMAEEIEAQVYGGPELPAAELAASLVDMRARIEKELAAEHGRSYDIKTGRGGIVDIEFAAQYLQLVHGRTRPSLRVGGTLEALDAAAAAGVLAEPDRQTLAQGY